ncbi:diguanylate cyclase [Sulfuricurvum sp.]|uniref:diguanylate cyclase n=1 Tax=Sulfuricurvum sp. TaxID=2025608 RepID=UPI002E308AA0|nr:diguanylate cyclase [Sulfuricurvum sp.]HEX5330201.1 diguanylate cyclase [Sulfuricurvum sp.]
MKRFKEQIRWKLLLLFSLLLLGISFILTGQHIISYKNILQETFDEQKSLLKDNMILRAKNHTESLAIQLENELAAYNFSKFSELVINDAGKSEAIIYIGVVDRTGNIIIQSQKSTLPKSDFSLNDLNSSDIIASEQLYKNHPVLVIKKSLYMGSEPWGVLTLYFSQTELEKKVLNYSRQMEDNVHQSLYQSLISMVIFLVLFLPIAYSMAIHISNPIIDLTKRAEELSNGNFMPKSVEIENRKDELGILERTFDKMSENLQNSYNRLALYNTQLEQMVQTRTLELEEKNIELEKLSITDKLTQLYNRVKLEEVFNDQIQAARRYNAPFSILLCDVDLFKNVNDTFGHLIGDKILVEIASILNSTLRETDIIGRWGGEEFLIICRETDQNQAVLLAERLRSAIEHQTFSTDQPQTISIGISCFCSNDTDVSMIKRSDSALYEAKTSGRNRVVFSPC